MSISSLEGKCLSALGEFTDRLDPNIFTGIPRHLLVKISKCLNPFDLERLENDGVFKKAGISTESLWKERYHHRWMPRPLCRKVANYRNIHVPEGILREACIDCDSWRAAYLGRHLQEVLNERQNVTDWVHRDIREVYLSPLLNHIAYERIWSLDNTLNHCSRYAACLTLSNRACVYLAENPSVFLRFADYVKFLRVNFVQKSGIASVCSLLETLTSKNLIGLEFCMCRHVDPWSWSKIFNARLQDSKSKQLSSWQVIHNNSLSATCNCQDSQAITSTNSCTTSPDTGHLHPCCTSSNTSLQDKSSTFACRRHMHYSHDTCPSSEGIKSSLNRHKQVESDSLDVCTISNRNIPPIHYQDGLAANSISEEGQFVSSSSQTSVQYYKDPTFFSTDEKAQNDNRKGIHLYDFDADMEKCADGITSHSKTLGSPSCLSEQTDSDLYDEVFACTRVTDGTPYDFLFRSPLDTVISGRATPENGNPQMYGMEALPRPNVYTGIAETSTLISFLRHLKYSSDSSDPTGSSLALLLKMLQNCHSLESLVVVFSQSCEEAEAFVNAILDLCSKGKLRYVELHDLYLLPVTDNFIKVLCQAVGAYCTACQPDVPASLRYLHLLGNPSISAEVVGHFAKRLANVCSCLSTGESGKAQAELVGLAQMEKAHQTVFKEPPVCGESVNLGFENSEGRKKELPKDACGKQNSRTSGCPEEIPDLSGRCVSPFDVQVKQDVEAGMRFTGLQELKLSCWCIGDNGAKAIAASLERNSMLICLALPQCDISTPGMSAIFRAVTGNRTLKTLNLSMNCYSLLADNSLATMLRTSQGLSELDVSHCFSDEGLTQEVVFSLCQNNSLECLKLNENRLGDSGMEMLAEVFRKPETKSRITRLELSSNLVTSSSVMALVTALHSFKPRRLEELVLGGNYFGSNINKTRACLRHVVDSVYVSNEDSALICADYVSQM